METICDFKSCFNQEGLNHNELSTGMSQQVVVVHVSHNLLRRSLILLLMLRELDAVKQLLFIYFFRLLHKNDAEHSITSAFFFPKIVNGSLISGSFTDTSARRDSHSYTTS